MPYFYIITLSGLSVFIGFPYFVDPVAAAAFHEIHWLQGLLQGLGFFFTGWFCREVSARPRDPGQQMR